ncbi:hypothetical protein [Erwinia sp. SLM-02]|uniref:hypothetical protein n=1 Tax=Erwinia sp. SLM-02 TaxID=3020057 RepID=UPI003080E315
MGFPSPAKDYVETRLDLNALLISHPLSTMIINDVGRLVIVDRSLRAGQGDTVAFELFGEGRIGKLSVRALITEEGEAIEGEALDEVTIIGRVTHIALEITPEHRPTI